MLVSHGRYFLQCEVVNLLKRGDREVNGKRRFTVIPVVLGRYSKSVDRKESPVVEYLNHVQSLTLFVKEKFSGKLSSEFPYTSGTRLG
ncbi:hypothetical protein DKX38_008351 [Salix brachista]|uniref:Uncharacterized protein n=1 Tax=Salix brachista TaxID=2182728 RepID=A0A5N5MR21_9ROSI|nr:hypothetical protein DKX38_008351 [Salix brachista]